jgi:hypothetical protein
MAWLLASDIPMTLLNAALLALWPVLPMLIICYVRQSLIARRTRAVFALRKSEADQVCERINRITQLAESRTGFRLFFGAPSLDAAAHAEDMDDLQAHAQHLQATIRRLTRLPLQRLNYSGCGSARGAGPCSRAASCFRDVGMAASAHSGRK